MVLLCESSASLQPPLMKDVQSLVMWLNDRTNSGNCLGNKYSCFWAPSWATSSRTISVLLFRGIPSRPVRKTHQWSFILTEGTQVFRNCQVPCWFRCCRGKRQADLKCLGPDFFNSPALIYLLSGELFANSWCLQHSWVCSSFASQLLLPKLPSKFLRATLLWLGFRVDSAVLVAEKLFQLVCSTEEEWCALTGRSEQLSEFWLQNSTDFCLGTWVKV